MKPIHLFRLPDRITFIHQKPNIEASLFPAQYIDTKRDPFGATISFKRVVGGWGSTKPYFLFEVDGIIGNIRFIKEMKMNLQGLEKAIPLLSNGTYTGPIKLTILGDGDVGIELT